MAILPTNNFAIPHTHTLAVHNSQEAVRLIRRIVCHWPSDVLEKHFADDSIHEVNKFRHVHVLDWRSNWVESCSAYFNSTRRRWRWRRLQIWLTGELLFDLETNWIVPGDDWHGVFDYNNRLAWRCLAVATPDGVPLPMRWPWVKCEASDKPARLRCVSLSCQFVCVAVPLGITSGGQAGAELMDEMD